MAATIADLASNIKIIEKEDKSSRKEKVMAIVTISAITIIFSGLVCNKYFPITEGWFQDYARYISQGKFIYRDFYCPVPPGYIWITTLICKLTNYSFLGLRVYGIIERVILIAIVFELLSKVYSSKITFFSVLVGSIIYSSTNTDLFYGYYQSSLLCAMVMLYFAVRMYESVINSKKYAILYGLFAGITFCMKQNTGAFFAVFIGLGYIVLMRKVDLKKSIVNVFFAFFTAMSVLIALAVILAVNGALIPFFEQVIGGTSAKGSLGTVFTGFIFRMINGKSGLIFIFSTVLMFVLGFEKKFEDNNNESVSRMSREMIAFFWGAIICIAYYKWFRLFHLTDFLKSRSFIVVIAIVLSSVCVIAVSLVLFNKTLYFKNLNLNWLIYISYFFYFVGFFCYFSYRENLYTDWELYREYRQQLIYGLFFVNFLILVARLILVKKNIDIKGMLYIASFSFMYIHGMSYIVEDHGTLLLFSLITAEILSHETVLNCLKNTAMVLFGISTVLSIFIQKNNFTYNWWGVNTLEPTYKAIYTYDDPHLVGIKGDEQQTKALNEIYALIERNKQDKDTMYTFPHINYFNVMADLNSPTFCKVHYFDVCSDGQAISDAAVLEKNLPTFIVWQEISENAWSTHEAIFRGGNLSGQRKIRAVVDKYTKNGTYTLLGVFQFNQSDPIYIWGLNDGREWKIENSLG